MEACTACGHTPVTGGSCPACGAAAAGAAIPARTPGGAPPPARFPLYADEAAFDGEPSEPDGQTVSPEEPVADDSPEPVPVHGGSHAAARTGSDPLLWLVGVGIVLLFAVVGGALMLLGGGEDEGATALDPETTLAEVEQSSSTPDSPAPSEDTSEPEGEPTPEGVDRLVPADVAVPGSASASRDNAGNSVTYEADNLLDEDPRTAWRVAGDATGEVITFRFDDPVTVTDVGLVNGYAKEDPPNDWYLANRRVLRVEWSFGDDTSVVQDLTEEREVQRMEVEAVETDVVELRLVDVSDPGSRDYTAISEVSLTGNGG